MTLVTKNWSLKFYILWPGWCGSMIGHWLMNQEVWFDSQSVHMSKLGGQSPIGGVQEAPGSWFLSLMFLSLTCFPFFSEVNKRIFFKNVYLGVEELQLFPIFCFISEYTWLENSRYYHKLNWVTLVFRLLSSGLQSQLPFEVPWFKHLLF